MPKQAQRLIIFCLYIGLLLMANNYAFQQILPLNGAKGLWFYSGLASILLGNMLVTPFYTKPVDAISYAVAAMIALYSVHNWDAWIIADKVVFLFALSVCIIVLGFAFATILTKDSRSSTWQKWSNTFRILSDTVGNERLIFGTVALFALIVFHRESVLELATITSVWIIMIIKPERYIISIYDKITVIWGDATRTEVIGDIVAYQTPGLILVKQKVPEPMEFGTTLLLKDSTGAERVAVVLDCMGKDESPLVRAIIIDVVNVAGCLTDKLRDTIRIFPDDTAIQFAVSQEEHVQSHMVANIKKIQNGCLGIVAQETSIEYLYFDVIQEKGLEEGKLVEVLIKGQPVLYQVVNGYTKEEVVFSKHTYGFARAKAKKIGTWDASAKKFSPAKWIPVINSPVFLRQTSTCIPELNAVGHFPGSDCNVYIEDVNALVTHNTAILGILGVGKSMLSIELVERMMAEKIKVICIDLTDQYAKELNDFYEAAQESIKQEELRKIGKDGKPNVKQNVEEGGSIKQFASATKAYLKEFMSPDCSEMIKIFNPSTFEVWRQDSKPFSNNASMITLTPTDITQIISESVLEIVQDLGMSNKARVCLVYEEAHSLVPEWNSIVADGDRSATNGTARAILQGRKYGLGCLLVTQRTANVTKTILNQCNTIFAMRTFDDTGKEFLSNYIGSDYASILPSLQERHAVFFGKASSCENPVLIRLNDKDDFRYLFRKSFPPPISEASMQ